MESIILHTPVNYIPITILDKVSGIIVEWERMTGLYNTFTLTPGYNVYTLKRSPLSGIGSHTSPEICLGGEGVLYYHLIENLNNHRVGIGFYFSRGVSYLDFKREGEFPEWRTTKDAMSKYIGVEDIFNIQPHEYGVIKLKYGVDRDSMFVPQEVKRMFKV